MQYPQVNKYSVLLWIAVSKNHPSDAIQSDGFLALPSVSKENCNEIPAHFKDLSVLPIDQQILNRHDFLYYRMFPFLSSLTKIKFNSFPIMCKVLTYIEDMNIYTHLELSMLYQLLRMF